MANKIQLRRDTATAWTAANPVLAQGEIGLDLTNSKIKIGTGNTAWNSLSYFDDKETNLEGYATESYVDDAIAAILQGPGEVDLTGYATESYVDDAISAIEIPDVSSFITAEDIPAPVNLTDYALTSQIPDVSTFITSEDIPPIPADISDLTDAEGLLGSGSTGNILFNGNDISNSVDNEISVTTEKTITTNNSYTNSIDFSTDIDIGGGTIIPGWTQRNLEQIEFSFFGPTEFRSFLTELILGRTVIVTYSTTNGNQTITGILTQQFTNLNEQEDPNNPGWVRVAGRIDATLPVDQTGIVSVNFPVYSLQSNSWEFNTDGDLTLPAGGDIRDSNGDSVLGESRVKLQSPGDRRIEEVYGYKEVSVTEPGTVNLTTTASRNSDGIARIWIDTTTTTIDEILDNTDAAGITDFNTIEFSLDNTTWYTVGGIWFEGDERGYGVNIGGDTLTYSQGDTVYFRYEGGGAPVTWWDKSELPGGGSDFRGAVIDYHAYTGESTIIGTIHIVDDDGEDHITHTEVQSGSTDGENDDLWVVTTEGQIKYRRIDQEEKTLKIQWSAKVFYGSEAYD
jgi:hypothetical protein